MQTAKHDNRPVRTHFMCLPVGWLRVTAREAVSKRGAAAQPDSIPIAYREMNLAVWRRISRSAAGPLYRNGVYCYTDFIQILYR